MLRRFAAACFVGSVVIAIASAVVQMIPGLGTQRLSLLLAIWCMVPCVWGLWAMLAPSTWVPLHLPTWGAILGFLVGVLAFLVLNLPFLIVGVAFPTATRGAGVVIAALLYYLLWTLVRITYQKLPGSSSSVSGG